MHGADIRDSIKKSGNTFQDDQKGNDSDFTMKIRETGAVQIPNFALVPSLYVEDGAMDFRTHRLSQNLTACIH